MLRLLSLYFEINTSYNTRFSSFLMCLSTLFNTHSVQPKSNFTVRNSPLKIIFFRNSLNTIARMLTSIQYTLLNLIFEFFRYLFTCTVTFNSSKNMVFKNYKNHLDNVKYRIQRQMIPLYYSTY